jgi:hypothetical protein
MLNGTCHCGALSWSLEGDPGSITACNCTLCRRYGTLWAYVRLAAPEAVADLKIDHFDGLNTFTDLPGYGRCVRDLWF